MRAVPRWAVAGMMFLAMAAASLPAAAQAPDNFRWIDFRSPKDQDVVIWVTRALDGQQWTAIREIGVEYDAALVVTTERASPQAGVNHDTFAVWSVSLSNRLVTAVLKGADLRLLDWVQVSPSRPKELAAVFQNCADCAATTYFTTFYYDLRQHTFTGRWLRGAAAVPLWTEGETAGVTRTEIYAALMDEAGTVSVGTWSHLDYGKERGPEDFVYRYDVDPLGGVERSQLLTGPDATYMKGRICRAEDAPNGLERGQDSALCAPFEKARPERHPVTTPPANNRGQSRPPRY